MKEAFFAPLGYTYLLVKRQKETDDALRESQNAAMEEVHHKRLKEDSSGVQDTLFWRRAQVEDIFARFISNKTPNSPENDSLKILSYSANFLWNNGS